MGVGANRIMNITPMVCYSWLGSIALVLSLAACGHGASASGPVADPPVECGDGGMAACTAARPDCASETVKCINGYCVYAPRPPSQGSSVCKCYAGQIVGCSPVTDPSPWAQDAGVRGCNVVDDTHADWDPACWALAIPDGGTD